jgi:hypothetical protein
VQVGVIVAVALGLGVAVAIDAMGSSSGVQAAMGASALVGCVLIQVLGRRYAGQRQRRSDRNRGASPLVAAGALAASFLVFALGGPYQLLLVSFADGVFIGLVVRGLSTGELRARAAGYDGVWPRR